MNVGLLSLAIWTPIVFGAAPLADEDRKRLAERLSGGNTAHPVGELRYR